MKYVAHCRYRELRRSFNANIVANCSSQDNVHWLENENLEDKVENLSENGHLNSKGIKRLIRNWDSLLKKVNVTTDGVQFVHRSFDSDGLRTFAGHRRGHYGSDFGESSIIAEDTMGQVRKLVGFS